MRNVQALFAVLAATLLAACSQSGSNQVGRNNGEKQEFGSATDITPAGNPNQPTNDLNRLDNGLGGAPNRESGNYQTQPVPAQQKDSELAKQIKVALTTGSTGTTGAIAENQLTKIDVQVHDGVVTLAGGVASEKERQIILKQVGGFKGVRKIVDRLQVGGRVVEDKPLEPLVPRSGQ
jgi:hypothetical protein